MAGPKVKYASFKHKLPYFFVISTSKRLYSSRFTSPESYLHSVLEIRIRWICIFLGLPDPHPDPLVRGTDPRIRIRIHIRTQMSRIPNTGISFNLFFFFKKLPVYYPFLLGQLSATADQQLHARGRWCCWLPNTTTIPTPRFPPPISHASACRRLTPPPPLLNRREKR
jgi:hypothetical protein